MLEGRLIWLALETLKLGISVVLDFGFWSRDERSALRWLATSAGASARVICLPLDRATQVDRIRHRWMHAPDETFKVTEADLDTWRVLFEVPDAAELNGAEPAGPPPVWSSWPDWAAARWPSLADD